MKLKVWTLEEVLALSPSDLQRLYKKVEKPEGSPEAEALKKLITTCGRYFSNESAINFDDPVAVEIANIVWGEGAKLIAATEAGEPALAGVEPILQSKIGDRYRSENYGTVMAGRLVGERMRQLGYVNDRKKNMPEGSVATTAETWRRRDA